MNDRIADSKDWEGRRQLSFALAMCAEPFHSLMAFREGLTRSVHELGMIVIPPRQERIICISLFVLALLSAADVWATRVAANVAPPGYITSAPVTGKDIQVVSAHPALSAAMVSAGSPF